VSNASKWKRREKDDAEDCSCCSCVVRVDVAQVLGLSDRCWMSMLDVGVEVGAEVMKILIGPGACQDAKDDIRLVML